MTTCVVDCVDAGEIAADAIRDRSGGALRHDRGLLPPVLDGRRRD